MAISARSLAPKTHSGPCEARESSAVGAAPVTRASAGIAADGLAAAARVAISGTTPRPLLASSALTLPVSFAVLTATPRGALVSSACPQGLQKLLLLLRLLLKVAE